MKKGLKRTTEGQFLHSNIPHRGRCSIVRTDPPAALARKTWSVPDIRSAAFARRWFALLALVGSALPSYADNPGERLDPAFSALAPDGVAPRIAALVHDWFAALETAPFESGTLEGFVAKPSFELSLIGARVRSLDELAAWRSHLGATHRNRVYKIDSIHLEPAGDDLHWSARFEFERRAVDDGGSPHIARRAHTWRVRATPGEPLVIVRIDARPLLAYPGTGPQIICY